MTKWDWRKVICVLMVLAVIGWVDDHLFPSAQAAIVLEVGSKGENVVKVQKRLIQYDYLSGTADGLYGEKTRDAVKLFQRRNGLTADGKVGPATAAALGVTLTASGGGSVTTSSTSGSGYISSDHRLLAKLVYAVASDNG